jgi:general secretion pathway protein G
MVMRRRRGFTLIELLVVLAIIGVLLSIAAPRYIGSVDKAKENVLRENLATLREAIDKHYADKGAYPTALEDLVTKRYLRRIPPDPITDSATTWIAIPPPEPLKGAVFDVKSGARGKSRDGSAYRDW